MRHLGFHSDFIGLYYPHILLLLEGTVTILMPKKGDLEEIRKYHGWSSSHGGSAVTMIDSDDLVT